MENNFEISEYWSMFLELNILRKQETYFLLIFHFMSTTHGTFLRNTVQWADLCSSQKTTRTPPGGKRLKLARKTLRIAVTSCNYIFTWAEFFSLQQRIYYVAIEPNPGTHTYSYIHINAYVGTAQAELLEYVAFKIPKSFFLDSTYNKRMPSRKQALKPLYLISKRKINALSSALQ